MTTWTTQYVPVVDAPTKSKQGWKFPYNGDDWPTKDDWYWVWACKPDRSPDSVFVLAQVAWWDGQKQRFLALGDKTVYAWHKAVPVKTKRYGKVVMTKMTETHSEALETAHRLAGKEFKAKLAEIDAEFADKAATVTDTIAALEAESRTAVLEHGATVKGAYIQAVWTKGRVSWDTKSLDGFVLAHPELASLRKEGDPSVSLRKI